MPSEQLRLDWVEQLMFIDETLFSDSTGWRHHAWAPTGEPAWYFADTTRVRSWSVLPAHTVQSIAAYLVPLSGRDISILSWSWNGSQPAVTSRPFQRLKVSLPWKGSSGDFLGYAIHRRWCGRFANKHLKHPAREYLLEEGLKRAVHWGWENTHWFWWLATSWDHDIFWCKKMQYIT